MIALWIFLGVLAFYVLFSLIPTLFGYHFVFKRKIKVPFEKIDLPRTHLAPFAGRITDAFHFLQGCPQRQLTAESFDGLRLVGTFYDAGSENTVLFFHGFYTSAMTNFASQGRFFFENGYNLLFADQRAHGESGGDHVTLGILESEDVFSWIAALKEKTGTRRVLPYGTSMGAVTVAYASDRLDPADTPCMILDCGYSSPYDQLRSEMKKRHLPRILMMPTVLLLTRIHLHLKLKKKVSVPLKKTRIPALFLDCEGDKVVPLEQGTENFNACASEKERILVPGGSHTTAFLTGGEEAKKIMIGFADRYMKKGTVS